jgi:hypothetical protein
MHILLRRAGALSLFLALAGGAPAAADPAPPLDALGWLTGTWSCATAGANPLTYKQTYAVAAGGRAIAQSYTLLGTPFHGTIAFDGKQFVYTSETKVQGTNVVQHMTAPPSSISKDSFAFSGTVTAHGKSEQERWTGKASALNAYTDSAFMFAEGKWQPILQLSCKRV